MAKYKLLIDFYDDQVDDDFKKGDIISNADREEFFENNPAIFERIDTPESKESGEIEEINEGIEYLHFNPLAISKINEIIKKVNEQSKQIKELKEKQDITYEHMKDFY